MRGDKTTWYDLIADLTAVGHYMPGIHESYVGILGYTWTQFWNHVTAAERHRYRERADRIEDGIVATMSGKEASKTIKELRKAGKS